MAGNQVVDGVGLCSGQQTAHRNGAAIADLLRSRWLLHRNEPHKGVPGLGICEMERAHGSEHVEVEVFIGLVVVWRRRSLGFEKALLDWHAHQEEMPVLIGHQIPGFCAEI